MLTTAAETKSPTLRNERKSEGPGQFEIASKRENRGDERDVRETDGDGDKLFGDFEPTGIGVGVP